MKQNDRGIALITVLLSLALVFTLATSVAIIGNLSYKTTLNSAHSLRNQYVAESQLSHTVWNIIHDLKENRNRRLGYMSEQDTEQEESGEQQRFIADGSTHQVDNENKNVFFKIEDANTGFDFDGTINSSKTAKIKSQINLPIDAETMILDEFFDKLIDYTDRNDLHQLNGAEREYYETKEGNYDLPRNNTMEYAEEAMWIPGVKEALFANQQYISSENTDFATKLHNSLKIIPYRGAKFPSSSKPNFFSASDYEIMSMPRLEESQLTEVLEARRAWYEERISIQESIPELYGQLARVFSFNESGIYRITVEVSNPDSSSISVIQAIVKLTRNLAPYRENTFSGIRYWRKVNF
ncbi:MAG: general secretion pathway protein GspK [Lentisphaeraceae bacterium]|nr:general secretion pathway protein GspK [Lentisphaeraceae bacterium]